MDKCKLLVKLVYLPEQDESFSTDGLGASSEVYGDSCFLFQNGVILKSLLRDGDIVLYCKSYVWFINAVMYAF